MATLGIVPDLVVGPEADPLGNGAVLLLLLGKNALHLEGLVRRLRFGGRGAEIEKQKLAVSRPLTDCG